MTPDATSPLKGGMDCARVAREEILEGYLLGKLSGDDRDAFEQHYFECAQCFDELRTVQATRDELASGRVRVQSNTWHWLVRWLPLGLAAGAFPTTLAPAGVVVAVLAGFVWLWSTVSHVPNEAPNSLPSQAPSTQAAPGRSDGIVGTAATQQVIEPPPYQPQTLPRPLNEATRRFEHGMESYRKADYGVAVTYLRSARAVDPNAVDINFFLGVSELVLGNLDPAINSLRQTIALGRSQYLADAHFYLAKAFLQRNDPLAAESELGQLFATDLRGSRREETFRLLDLIHHNLTGTISGTVIDSTGAAFPGVRVTMSDVGTGRKFIFVVDDAGEYFARLPIGNYDVTFVTPTIKTQTFVVRGRSLHGGEDLKIHPRLSRETTGR